jgi:hypothetical protein
MMFVSSFLPLLLPPTFWDKNSNLEQFNPLALHYSLECQILGFYPQEPLALVSSCSDTIRKKAVGTFIKVTDGAKKF